MLKEKYNAKGNVYYFPEAVDRQGDVKKARQNPFEDIVTQNREMLSLLKDVKRIARTSNAVLITGETGVGKELAAKAIHAISKRKGPFIAENVAGLDDAVFSDTLFGHVKGAFTGAEKDRKGLIEEASGGTLLLDEIGDLGALSQIKLLRLLQERTYLPLGSDRHRKTDVRIITSTNKNLWTLQRCKQFRKDLNFRLRAHHVHIPPLRDRMDDLPLLADHFLGVFAKEYKIKKPVLPEQFFSVLKTHTFPGNVRELEHMMSDALSRSDRNSFSVDAVKAWISHMEREGPEAFDMCDEGPLVCFRHKLPTIKQANELLVEEAMRRAGGKVTAAAKMLGISHQALSKRLKKMNSEQ